MCMQKSGGTKRTDTKFQGTEGFSTLVMGPTQESDTLLVRGNHRCATRHRGGRGGGLTV